MTTCGVYVIKNSEGYFYVGSSSNLKKRIHTHFRSLRKGRHPNIFFQRVFDKFGEESFKVEVLKTKTTKAAREAEQGYLDKYDGHRRMMNISRGATGGDNLTRNPNRKAIIRQIKASLKENIGSLSAEDRSFKYGQPGHLNGMFMKTHSDSAKAEMAQRMLGNTPANKGVPMSDKQRKKLSEAATLNSALPGYCNPFAGKHHTEETKAKLARKARKRVAAGILPNTTRRVKIEGTIYRSVSFASRQLGVVPATIINRIRNPNFSEYEYLD